MVDFFPAAEIGDDIFYVAGFMVVVALEGAISLDNT